MKISNNLIQACRLMNISKFSLWGAILTWISITLGLIVVVACLIRLFLSTVTSLPLITMSSLWLILIATAPLFAGVNMVAIKYARGESASIRTVFQYFNQWLPLTLAFLIILCINYSLNFLFNKLIHVIIALCFSPQVLNNWLPNLLVPLTNTIFLNFAYALLIFVIPLIADRQLPVISAFSVSAKIAQTHWLKLFTLISIFYVVNLLDILLLLIVKIPFIGIICYIIINIWFIPFIFLNIGIAYNHLFDRDQHYAQPLLSTN